MPPSFYCKPRWIKAGGRSTGHSLAPSTQIQFMNNQSKKCLSEQHCLQVGDYVLLHIGFVMSKIDEEEAQASLESFRQMVALMPEQDILPC